MRRSSPPLERSIDFQIGSGNHSSTYAHQDIRGRLIELPLSWYSENGGSWFMSPGYDRPNHSGFQRAISASCLFCHNGYPSPATGALAAGIDCERCHGPGDTHANRGAAIVNPAKLSNQRQLDVCLQCHLESASRTLPDSIRRFGRSEFSYHAGEPLSEFMLYFEYANAPAENRITVNGAGYGLLKSKCFQASAGKLLCTTCHNPHGAPASTAQFTKACRSCHSTTHNAKMTGCIDCHMQKRRTEDAVHVVMTDHRIRRKPFEADQLKMIPEQRDHLSGPVKPLYPATLPDTAATQLYLAMASKDARLLESAVTQANPLFPEPWFALAEAMRNAGRSQDAIRAFRRVVELDPKDPRAYIPLTDLLLSTNQPNTAAEILKSALERIPNDTSLLNAAAIVGVNLQRFDSALSLLSKAISIDGEDALTWLNMGVALEAKNDREGARNAYMQCLTLDPLSQRANEYLQRLNR